MRRAILILSVLAFSCTESTAEQLTIISVAPSSGFSDQAIVIVISGKGFYSEAAVSFDETGNLPVDDGFEATLGSTPLENVTALDAENLEATVPAGMTPGIYAITVKIPSGELATLADAFTVEEPPLAPRLAITTLSLAPTPDASTGDLLTLTYVVENTGRLAATNVQVPVPVSLGAAASEAPPPDDGSTPSSVAEIQPGFDATFTRRFVATGPGTLSFSAFATGFFPDGTTAVRSPSETSNSITVSRATSLVASLDATPIQVSEGQPITVTMTVVNNGQVAANSVAPTALTASGTATYVLSNPTPLSIASLTGGASDTFTWTVTTAPGDAGTLSFTGTASGQNSISSDTVTATPVSTPGMLIQTRPVLSLTANAPPQMGRFQNGVLVSLEVANTGEATATISDADLQITGTDPSKFAITPTLTATSVPGGESRDLTFRVDVTDPAESDTYTADGQIVAVDGNDASYPLDINFGNGTPDTFVIAAEDQPAVLNITLEIISPSGAADRTVSTQQSFTVRAVVQNAGTCNVTGGELTLSLGSTGATGSNLTVPLVIGQPIDWDLTASSTANGPENLSVDFSTAPTHESCAGSPDTSSAPTTLALTTVDRAHLVISADLLAPADDGVVNLGEQFQLQVRVNNTGTASVAGTAELEVDPGNLLLTLDAPSSLTQAFTADGTNVTFSFTASTTTTSSDGLFATIVTVPDDENTNADAHADPISVTLPLEVVDPNVLADNCEECGGATQCRDSCAGSASCTLPNCVTGCTCEMACRDTGSCTGTCDNGSTCEISATNMTSMSLACSNGSTCELNCRDMSSCSLDCLGTASCLIHCQDVSSCNLNNCTPTPCGGGTSVCHRTCP